MIIHMLNSFFNYINRKIRFFKNGTFFDLTINSESYFFEDNSDKEENTLEISALTNEIFLIKLISVSEERNNKTILLSLKDKKAFSGLKKYGGLLNFIYV